MASMSNLLLHCSLTENMVSKDTLYKTGANCLGSYKTYPERLVHDRNSQTILSEHSIPKEKVP